MVSVKDDSRTKRSLNAHIDITGAYVNDIPTNYSYVDPTAKLTLGDDTTIAHHHVYKSKYLTALREGDEGELSISIPKICIKQVGTKAVYFT